MLIQKKTANVVNPEVGGVSGHILIAFFFLILAVILLSLLSMKSVVRQRGDVMGSGRP